GKPIVLVTAIHPLTSPHLKFTSFRCACYRKYDLRVGTDSVTPASANEIGAATQLDSVRRTGSRFTNNTLYLPRHENQFARILCAIGRPVVVGVKLFDHKSRPYQQMLGF